jgi:hypothetical protein
MRLHAYPRRSIHLPKSPENREAALESYERVLLSVERKYPLLNPDSAQFDEDLMLQVYRRMRALVDEGMAPALAVALAATQLLGRFGTH